MRRIVLVSSLLAAAIAVAGCSDRAGDGDGDVDADTDGDGDVDADTDADVDADGDVDADADGDGDAEVPCPEPPEPGEEICGNCYDEDGDGEAPSCPLDEIYLTPRRVPPGGTVTARACTRADPAYSCIDVRCVLECDVVRARLVDASYQMGLSCWELEVTLPSPGTWACSFRRLSRDEEGRCSEAAGAVERACDTVVVEG